MLTLSALGAALAWLGTHAYLLFIALIPSVLDFLKPIFAGVINGVVSFISTIWEGARKADFSVWMLILAVSALAGFLGYHYGWQSCIDWVHTHFKLVSKIPVSHWWKLW